MKNIILSLALCLVYLSCNEASREKGERIEKLFLSVYTSKNSAEPLNLLFDFRTQSVVLYGTGWPHFSIPPPPLNTASHTVEETTEEPDYTVNTETFALNKKDEILNILSQFKAEDFEDKQAYSIDGGAVTITVIYSNNNFKKVTLINDYTSNQVDLLREIFIFIYEKSKQTDILENYYGSRHLYLDSIDKKP